MRDHLTDAAADLNPAVVEQPAPTGMLDAILLAVPAALETDADRAWIAWCDQVALLPETLAQLATREQTDDPAAFIFPTVTRDEPYIHFERDTDGRISRVLQRREEDAMPPRGESDAGLFACRRGVAADRCRATRPPRRREAAPASATSCRSFRGWRNERASRRSPAPTRAKRSASTRPTSSPRSSAGSRRGLPARERHSRSSFPPTTKSVTSARCSSRSRRSISRRSTSRGRSSSSTTARRIAPRRSSRRYRTSR